jgi:hypothetical protein
MDQLVGVEAPRRVDTSRGEIGDSRYAVADIVAEVPDRRVPVVADAPPLRGGPEQGRESVEKSLGAPDVDAAPFRDVVVDVARPRHELERERGGGFCRVGHSRPRASERENEGEASHVQRKGNIQSTADGVTTPLLSVT